MKIDSFTGEYEFLSNFSKSIVYYDGVQYPTVEHAYQAAKTLDLDKRLVISELKTPALAKKAGRKLSIREDWGDVKIGIMESLVRQKFVNNPTLRFQLTSTMEAELIEGNWWKDTFWGICNGVGENHLGKILMKIRNELRFDSFLHVIYELSASNVANDCMHVVTLILDKMQGFLETGNINRISDLMDVIDVSKLRDSALVSILGTTFWIKELFKSRAKFYDRVMDLFTDRHGKDRAIEMLEIYK